MKPSEAGEAFVLMTDLTDRPQTPVTRAHARA